MQVVELPFGEFLPDAPDYKNPGCVIADNCFPSSGGYSPFKGAEATGDLIDEVVQGAREFFRNDGRSVIVGGTSTKLFVLVGGTLTETTGYSAIGDGEQWTFAQFNLLIIATAPNNAPQYLTTIESDVTWSALPGSPPTAKVNGRVGTFHMLGNIASAPSRIQWSAENDPTAAWVTDRLLQSGLAEMQVEYGEITGITGDRYPLIFQQRAISRIDPVGPPTVFQIATIEEARGSIAPGSIVTVGWMTFFLSHDGFFATDGAQVSPIGTQRVNEWFFSNVSEPDRFRTHGAIAWGNQSIVWTFYPASDPTAYTRQIIYSWAENRWSTGSLSVDRLVENKTNATTLEELDALFPSGLETVTPNMDSSFWLGKLRTLSAFIQDGSGNSEMNLLKGDALAANFETSENEPKPGSRVSANAVLPIVENVSENTTGYVVTRALKGATEVTSTATAINSSGACPVRADGRFMRAGITIPAAASWDKAQGVQVELRASGRR